MMKRWTLACALALAWIFALSGCAGAGSYLANRGADLADILTAELSFGPGLDVHAQATGYLGAVVGWADQRGVMLHGRCAGTGRRDTIGYLIVGSTGASSRRIRPLCGKPDYCSELWGADRGRHWGFFLPRKGSVMDWPRNWDFEIGASAVLVGAHVGLSPGELLDFLTGLVTIDIAGDDYHPDEEQTEQRPAPAEEDEG